MKEKFTRFEKLSITLMILTIIATLFPNQINNIFLSNHYTFFFNYVIIYKYYIISIALLIILFTIIRRRKARLIKDRWIDDLNKLYPSDAKIFKILHKKPLVKYMGVYELSDAQNTVANTIKDKIKTNDPHAILDGNIEWKNDDMIIPYKTLRYHELKVLRMAFFTIQEYNDIVKISGNNFSEDMLVNAKNESIVYRTEAGIFIDIAAFPEGKTVMPETKKVIDKINNRCSKPKILSACAVVICPERRQMILHHRSPNSATYKGCTHTIGGAFAPIQLQDRIRDVDLLGTINREVQEETTIPLSWNEENPRTYAEELSTGFIQIVYYGGTFPPTEVDKQINIKDWRDTPQEEEGKPIHIDFDGLKSALIDDGQWVPSGRLHVLSWLALGAPGCNRNERFGGLTAQQLFNSLIGKNQ